MDRYRSTLSAQLFLGSLHKISNWSSNNTVDTEHLRRQYRGFTFNCDLPGQVEGEVEEG